MLREPIGLDEILRSGKAHHDLLPHMCECSLSGSARKVAGTE
jgi:hypothetical protein